MDYKSLTDIIAAYRAETAAKSIAPENTGYILQTIIDLLNESVSELDRELSATLESYVADLQNTDADLSAKLLAQAKAINELSATLESYVADLQNTDADLSAKLLAQAKAINELSATLESYVADLQNTDADLSAKLLAQAKAINELSATLENKQDKLVPGENIANVNGLSLLDGGNIEISADGGLIKSLSTAEILEAIAEAENE